MAPSIPLQRNRIMKPVRFSKSANVLCIALILFAPLISEAQSTGAVDLPDSTQLRTMIANLDANRPDEQKLTMVRTVGFDLLAAARYSEAWTTFNAILKWSANDQQALYGSGLALFNLKQLTEAEGMARSAVSIARVNSTQTSPSDSDNWRRRESDSLVLLAVVLAVKSDNAGALEALRRASDLSPESFDAFFALGRALYGAGDLAAAAIAFRKAILLRPQDLQARFFLATTLESSGNNREARENYRELIRLQAGNAEGHLGLGALLVKLDANSKEGISELLEAVKLKEDLYEARIVLGRALIKAGRHGEALDHLRRAAQLAPDNPEPHYQLAIAYRRLGRPENAEQEANIVKEINLRRRSKSEAPESKLSSKN
jgi:Flp pilus assembly protein TadD